MLIFTNLIINYCILSAVQKFLHIKTTVIRLLLSSLTGALFSLIVFLPVFETAISLLIKLLCACVMCLVAFRFTGIFIYIKYVCTTFTISMIFCGMMILLYQVVKPKTMAIINDTVYFQIEPLVLIGISVAIYLVILIISRLFQTDISNTMVNLNMTIDDKEYSCIGKIDTGNSLTEPFSGSPVIVAEKSILGDIKGKAARVVPYKALGNTGIVYAVKANKVVIDKKEIPKDIYIGIYDGDIDPNFKAIINHNIVR